MRVVFDSNIFISALVFPGKRAEKAIARIIEGDDQPPVSEAITGEVSGVLARRFAREPEDLARIVPLRSYLEDWRKAQFLGEAAAAAMIIGQSAGGGKLELDLLTLAGTRLLIQANSGGGKSWLLRLSRARRHSDSGQ